MKSFMLDRQVLVPPEYAERSCVLVKYRLPFLQHCFVLCHEHDCGADPAATQELFAFFLAQAQRLAFDAVGDAQAFPQRVFNSEAAKPPSSRVRGAEALAKSLGVRRAGCKKLRVGFLSRALLDAQQARAFARH
ncbi:hypothetical protein [Caldimonas brevitalea]|uniref:hypothetical protein n=1 Tax=Caldimonas brevitalea TaxID=413882 RepID=UPI0012FB4956|nr:hypothetical protein [Caldimonas brevitalea]